MRRGSLIGQFLRHCLWLTHGLIETVHTTKNWWSVLALHFGVTSSVSATFRNGAKISINRETLPQYVRFVIDSRRLFSSGVRYIGEFDGLWELELPNGIRFLVRPLADDAISLCEIFLDKYYGVPDVNAKVVVDIGAGIGDSSLYFAHLGAEVYAFEPLPDSSKLAKRNIELNRMEKRVHLYNNAVSSAASLLSLKTVKGSPLATTTSFLQNPRHSYVEAGVAEAVTLGWIIEQHGLDTIHLLKLDCEGCEFDVLCDGNEEALGHVQMIVMEYHSDPSGILRFLERIGFSTRSEETLRAREEVEGKMTLIVLGRIHAERIQPKAVMEE